MKTRPRHRMAWRVLSMILLLALALPTVQAAPWSGEFAWQDSILPDSAAPDTWAWQAGGALADVFLIDGSQGWITGGHGLVLHTTDAGASWSLQPGGTRRGLVTTYFVSAQRGWAAGAGGVIQHTNNSGASWLSQTSGTISDLNAIHFANDQRGWVVGMAGTIRRTSNGGATWAAATSGTTAALHAVQFVDTQRGWAVGSAGTILHTSDGGVSWSAQVSGSDATFYGISFVDAQRGWVVGRTEGGSFHGIILRTLDGGASWTSHRFSAFEALRAVNFVDADHGWAVGAQWSPNEPWRALILRTTNGGDSWSADYVGPLEFQLHSVHFATTSTGWAVGSWGGILGTTDGGASWRFLASPTGDTLAALRFTSTGEGWAVTQRPGEQRPVGVVLHTQDGGGTWSEQWAGRWLDSQKLNALDMIGAGPGWAVGFDGAQQTGLIVSTTDGTSWSPQGSGTAAELTAVDFVDAVHGWALDRSNQVLRTTDGGLSWTTAAPAGLTSLSAIHFVGPQRGWLTGAACSGADGSVACNAVIKQSTDGGASWSTQASLADRTLNGLHMPARQRGWVVGSAGTVLRTVDGVSWIPQNSGIGTNLSAVTFVDDAEGWIVGDAGTILHTLDAGVTWVAHPLPVKVGLRTVSFADRHHGWVGGEDGLILRYTGSGMGLQRAVAASLDDTCVHVASGANQVTSPILRLGRSSSSNFVCSVRFSAVAIPPGSQLVAASLTLFPAGVQTGAPVRLTIYGEATDNAVNFADTNPRANQRPRTAAAVPWTLTDRPDSWFRSPDLVAPLQEVVNRRGWQTGNALALLLVSETSNTYYLDARAYDGNPIRGARLTVWYQPPAPNSHHLWLPFAAH